MGGVSMRVFWSIPVYLLDHMVSALSPQGCYGCGKQMHSPPGCSYLYCPLLQVQELLVFHYKRLRRIFQHYVAHVSESTAVPVDQSDMGKGMSLSQW